MAEENQQSPAELGRQLVMKLHFQDNARIQPLYRSVCDSYYLKLKTEGFCWNRGITAVLWMHLKMTCILNILGFANVLMIFVAGISE